MNGLRKLAVAALAFSAAVFAANYILPSAWTPLCAAALAVLGSVLAALHRKWLRGCVIALLAASVGLGCFSLHEQRTTVPARELDGTEHEITARLLDYPQEYASYCRARVKLESDGLPRLEAFVYDNGKWLSGAQPGQLLRFTGKLRAADTKYGQDYTNYKAKDVYFTITARSAVLALDRGFDLRTLPVRLNHAVSQMVASIFPVDVSGYITALLLGDKTGLYADPGTELALSRAGFMHVVAVSGMHIAYLVTLLQMLFGRTRKSSLLCILLVWFFVLMTGASPSAVRAGIMQTLLLLASVVRRENDTLTSLSAALALILLVNPYAAASVSLQLSFSSMAGLMCFSDWFSESLSTLLPSNRLGRLLEGAAAVVAASLSAMVFTLPLVAIHFGYAAILSPLSGMLALWTVPLCFCGAYLACFIGALLPAAGTALAWLVAWPARFLLLVARLTASIPFAVVYLQNGLALLWLLFCYAAFAALSLTQLDRRLKLLLPAALSAAALFAVGTVTRASYEREPGIVSVLDVGQGQCITAYSGESTVMIDCGGLWSLENAGETAGAYLSACGRKQVDLLILTHLDEDHVNGVPMLLEMTRVKRIVMPVQDDWSGDTLTALRHSAERHGTELLVLREDLELVCAGIRASIFTPVTEGDANERSLMSRVSLGSYDVLVTGDASADAERALLAAHRLHDIELLVVGHHGSHSSSCEELLQSIGAHTAVISVGYNTYGHPSEETLERLDACGYTVFRTDQDGNIVIRIGREYGETERQK